MSEPATIDAKRTEQEVEYDGYVGPQEAAANRHMKVVFPTEHQLQIDMDSETAKEEFLKRFRLFEFPNTPWLLLTPSATAGHYHATLTFTDRSFTPWQRTCLESVLGDDPVRVFLNTKFLFDGVMDHSCLFEKP